MVRFWSKLRLSEPWQYKAPIILSMIYGVVYAQQITPQHLLKWLTLSLVTIIGIAGLGYLSNDWADQKTDREHGKSNFFLSTSKTFQGIVALGLTLFALAPWFLFPTNALSLWLLGAELTAFGIYAFPPLRLKTHVFFAPIVDAFYAHVLPATLATHTFYLIAGESATWQTLVPTAFWQLFLGIRLFINHLVIDRPNDIHTHQTLATRYHSLKLRMACIVLLVAELFSLSVLLYHWLGPFACTAIFLGMLLTVIQHPVVYSFREHAAERFYKLGLPYMMLLALSFYNPWFLGFLAVHAVLFPNPLPSETYLWSEIRSFLSKPVNLIIYYFRRLVLLQDRPKAYQEYYPEYLRQRSNQEKMKQTGTVIIANLNKDKYSETYVRAYEEHLSHGIKLIHGGYPPTKTDQDETIIDLEAYLRQTKAKMVFAHFGPMAVSMLPVCLNTGIPLMAYFHAYDIHHRDQIECYKADYLQLFQHVHALLASSKEIYNKLVALGAPEKKVHYLPAYVALEKFASDRKSEPSFEVLAVGRFCTTKAPHLTLLAFAEVLKKAPNAQLTMVGDGELLETCITLATSLNIAQHVTFTGALSHEEIHQMMTRSSVFVQHSLTAPVTGDREGTPVAIMEAMASGLPVVSTDHAGIGELIEDGKTGFLVKEGDYSAMADRIATLLESPKLSAEIGTNASNAIRKHHEVANHMAIVSHLIDQLALK
ncbi:glycosyltransferase [Marinoscillum furvescens]|uniref:Glycosyltransferase involved in cell wall biosynthesis n=1 Tax=Marinoscillum furvescens DSM 4134 TaxID=1122208 RepID=A0A3D9KXC7_MARFU|nr:glycosyltransferase [Marinoscillum furvescens]RED92305.1 glycosyltransferase involved in cell wall biosynthesis [Marinoscillum furvescens DSM 4134]